MFITHFLVSMLCGLLTLCVMWFGMLTYFVGKYGQKVSELSKLVLRRCIEWVLPSLLSRIPWLQHYIGSVSQQKLLFVPDADNNPEKEHEISEPALFRFLLNEETLKELDEADGAEIPDMLGVLKDTDKNWEITEFETHQSSMSLWEDFKGAFHVFIVFKTTKKRQSETADAEVYWWSLEKGMDYIVLQRSRNKENVKEKYDGKQRKKVKPIVENLEGKGTIQDLFAVLWTRQVIVEKYHLMESNCQSFVTFVGQQITNIEYKYEGVFKCPNPPENDRKTEMLDLINILRIAFKTWHPLFTLIHLDNTHLFDTISKGGKYNMDITQHGLTPLHFAILASKTKMVKHILKPPHSVDPTKRGEDGNNALQMAAMHAKETEIFDSLLAHDKVKIDDVDESGQTALHSAVSASNVAAVQHLLARGANFSLCEKKRGWSPLHVAAFSNRGTEILDLIFEAKKTKAGNEGIDDVDDKRGMTALHWAASSSNVITAEHLIKKGADLHCQTNNGLTPLHVAALFAENMQIIDVLLKNIRDEDSTDQYKKDAKLLPSGFCNKHKLEREIIYQLVAKGMVSIEQVRNFKVSLALTAVKKKFAQNRHSKSSNEHHELGGANLMEEAGSDRDKQPNQCIEPTFEHFREENTFKADVGDIAHFIGDNAIKMEDKVDRVFQSALAYAIESSDVEKVCKLSKQFGADFSKVTWGGGMNALHAASHSAKTTKILDVILANGKFDINGVHNGLTPLHYAIYAKNVITVGYLLEKGADPTIRDHNGMTPLHMASYYAKDMNMIKLLVHHKDVNVNYLDNSGHSTLDYAMNNEHGLGETIANLLREKMAAKADECNHEPENIATVVPTDHIKLVSDIETIRYLIENGHDVSALTWGENGANALHVAAADEETTDLIDAILETGKFDIDGADNIGWTPLHYAITGSLSAKNVHHLIQLGADPSVPDKNGVTPLHLAAENEEMTELIDLILEIGKSNINPVDINGRTPLHFAIKGPNPVAINARRLIKMGADPGIADKNGVTPLHMAARNEESMDLIEQLLNTEAVDVNCVDKQVHTPIDCARANKHGLGERIVARLREHDETE
jgi:ankyrin repeat protein